MRLYEIRVNTDYDTVEMWNYNYKTPKISIKLT